MQKLLFTKLQNVSTLSDLMTKDTDGILKNGLYIWGFQSPGKKFSPYYVGMTYDGNSIGKRLQQELSSKILLKKDNSNHGWRVTLHRDPEKELVFERVAQPGLNIDKKYFEKLVYYNNAQFMKLKYGDLLEKISKTNIVGFENWEQDFCQKGGCLNKLYNIIDEKLPYDSLPEALKELMDVYGKYLLYEPHNKRTVSDRLVFTMATLDEKKDQTTMEYWETILKFSLIRNVGSKSNKPPLDLTKKEEMETTISFDGPKEIAELFHQSKQPEFDRLFTWKRHK